MGARPKIVRRSLEAQAADVLRDRILSGEIPNGARLTEIQLSTELGLSRGPVRAALMQLSNEQLVIQKPYAGWEVRRLSRTDCWELNTLRGALEGLAAKLAAQRIDEVGARRLRRALERLEASCTSGIEARVTEADFTLHRTIIELAGHERLGRAYLLLEQQIRMLITAINAPFTELEVVARSHRDMVDAICRGDAAAAEGLAAGHNESLDLAMLTGAASLECDPSETPRD